MAAVGRLHVEDGGGRSNGMRVLSGVTGQIPTDRSSTSLTFCINEACCWPFQSLLCAMGILLASLPLLFLFFRSAGFQYVCAPLELTKEVGLPRACLCARRWLRDSFLASPDLLPHCSAAQLWALSSTVDEVQARELLLAMTLTLGRTGQTWTIADGHEALNGICGAGPNCRPMGTIHAHLYSLVHGRWLPAVPSNRQLLFTFVLVAVNMDPDGADATASAGVPPPLAGDRSPLDDAIRGYGVALAAL